MVNGRVTRHQRFQFLQSLKVNLYSHLTVNIELKNQYNKFLVYHKTDKSNCEFK